MKSVLWGDELQGEEQQPMHDDQARDDAAVIAPRRLTAAQGIALWADLMNTCEAFLLAGLRRKIGPAGDLVAAHREWYARQMAEHDQMMVHMAEEFTRRSRANGG